MKHLLDTHVLLWWSTASPSLTRLHKRIIDRAQSAGDQVGLSDISLWEIALLAKRGRLRAHRPVSQWLAEIERDPLFEVLPICAAIADEAAALGPPFPADPADRIIAATARCHGLTLLTEDEAIRGAGVVRVL